MEPSPVTSKCVTGWHGCFRMIPVLLIAIDINSIVCQRNEHQILPEIGFMTTQQTHDTETLAW